MTFVCIRIVHAGGTMGGRALKELLGILQLLRKVLLLHLHGARQSGVHGGGGRGRRLEAAIGLARLREFDLHQHELEQANAVGRLRVRGRLQVCAEGREEKEKVRKHVM
jgi:hypothetical protein